MFSSTTIASSMTMPTESVSASIVSMLSVKSMYRMRPNVAMIDVGMEIAAMAVDRRLPRNSSTTSAASTEPTMRCSWTLSIEASMNSPWSRTMRTWYPDGSVRSSSASRAFTPFTIATVFMPDCFRICSSTVGSPLTLASVPASAMPSSMRATSRTSTGCPATSRTTTSPNSAGRLQAPSRAHRDRLCPLLDPAPGHVAVLRLEGA